MAFCVRTQVASVTIPIPSGSYKLLWFSIDRREYAQSIDATMLFACCIIGMSQYPADLEMENGLYPRSVTPKRCAFDVAPTTANWHSARKYDPLPLTFRVQSTCFAHGRRRRGHP